MRFSRVSSSRSDAGADSYRVTRFAFYRTDWRSYIKVSERSEVTDGGCSGWVLSARLGCLLVAAVFVSGHGVRVVESLLSTALGYRCARAVDRGHVRTCTRCEFFSPRHGDGCVFRCLSGNQKTFSRYITRDHIERGLSGCREQRKLSVRCGPMTHSYRSSFWDQIGRMGSVVCQPTRAQ